MPEARLDRQLSFRLADDSSWARLLARLGPRLSIDGAHAFEGEGHVAPLDVGLAARSRIHLLAEPTGAAGYQQRLRLLALPPPGEPVGDVALPLLGVEHERFGRWVGVDVDALPPAAVGRELGYQGWWQYGNEAPRTDVRTEVIAHARHRDGDLLWLASRTNTATPGDHHKQVFVAVTRR